MTESREKKPGYKMTRLGWIPDDWKICPLQSIAIIINSNVDKKSKESETPVFLCNYMDVYDNLEINKGISFMQATATKHEIEKYSLKINDVIITKDSETTEDIANPAIVRDDIDNLLCGYHLTIIRSNPKIVDGKYLVYRLNHGIVHKYFATHANGSTRFGLRISTIEKSKIPIPPLHEQKKIANIISTWDHAIEQTQALIDAKRQLQRGLMQQLFTGRLRFPEFGPRIKKNNELPAGWHYKPLSYFMKKKLRKEKKPNHPFTKLGIRSHGKGIFTTEIEDPDQYSMKYFYRVLQDDFVVNITFAWEGAIAHVGPEGNNTFVSHRFPTYIINEKRMKVNFLKFMIHTNRFFYALDTISPGGAGRNRVMRKSDFLKIKVKFPNLEEQMKIANLLSLLENEIEDLEKLLKHYQYQKIGLLQKLLSGEVRV